MKRKCPYYYDLFDTFQDRAAMEPKCTGKESLDQYSLDDPLLLDEDTSDGDESSSSGGSCSSRLLSGAKQRRLVRKKQELRERFRNRQKKNPPGKTPNDEGGFD